MKKMLLYLLPTLLFICCNKPNLNGHYHVEWGNRSSFQTWNIVDNRMRINDSVCYDKTQICYGMPIKYKGDSIFVPWVDFIYAAKYEIDEKGIIYLNGYSNSNLILTPKVNCLTYDNYFNQKTKDHITNFNLLTNSKMYGKSVFPQNYKNELIIGKSEEKVFYIFNDKVLKFNSKTKSYGLENSTNKNDIWVHIDEKIKLNEALIILKEINEKGYSIYFSSKEKIENNEQIRILKKSVLKIEKKINSYIINSCEYCEDNLTSRIDSIIKFKIFDMDSCIVNNSITDFFQLRNNTVNFLKQNKTTRLNSQIQLEINSNILFKDYLELMTEIDFVNFELQGTTELSIQFPLRIKEVIKPF